MSRSNRLFEIIQLLRAASAPMTAAEIARRLEVTKRTIYRDIAVLQARRVPIEGEAGIGYVMRPGYDLPPLMFTPDEIEAITVGLAFLRRAGDDDLLEAAESAGAKIASVLPDHASAEPSLHVSDWSDMLPCRVDIGTIRAAIRDEEALTLTYCDARDRASERNVLPLAVIYNVQTLHLLAWCEMRRGFRHFRVDRMDRCERAGYDFRGQGDGLRRMWELEDAEE